MNTANACIFCGSHGPFETRSHIIPESLGGIDSPIASETTTCDRCNQYFGQKVESKVLKSFPFGTYRLFSSIPSKKGRMHSHPTTLGLATAAGIPGQIDIEIEDPSMRERILQAKSGQVRILAEVTEPLAVCRMLIKVGMELLARDHAELARSHRFKAARTFCRQPSKAARWWFSLHTDPTALLSIVGIAKAGDSLFWELSVQEIEGCACAIVRAPGLATIVPLEPNAVPPRFDRTDPSHRTVWATC